jgi:hypothetical protein
MQPTQYPKNSELYAFGGYSYRNGAAAVIIEDQLLQMRVLLYIPNDFLKSIQKLATYLQPVYEVKFFKLEL